MLVASALSVEISKLPPFESSPFPRTASHRSHQPHSPLPWAHSSIISSIAASLSAPLQSADNPSSASLSAPLQSADNPSSPHAPPPAEHPPPPSEIIQSPAADAVAALAEEPHAVHRGCIPPQMRQSCSIQ
jgi:hypothetical protein